MKINKLFLFLQNEEKAIESGPALKVERLQQKPDYYLYKLPLSRALKVGENENKYSVTEHHVTIHQYYTVSDLNRTYYHYTANLRDNQGQVYQLHVYFDENDRIVTAPILTLEKGETITKVQVKQSLSLSLAELAIEQSAPFVSELNAQFQQNRARLEADYEEREKHLSDLSQHLTENKKEYLECLQKTRTLANQLTYYDNENHYSQIESFLTEIQTTLERSPKDISPRPAPIEQQQSKDKSEELVEVISSSATIVKTMLQENIADLVKTAKHNHESLMQAKNSDFQDRIQLLNRFSLSVADCVVATMTEESSHKISASHLHAIQSMVQAKHKLGRQLLLDTISFNNIAVVKQLKEYINPIPAKIIQFLIKTDNAAMLELILENSPVALNSFIVENEMNPIQYCLATCKDKKPKKAVFALLIKNQASLMVKAQDGLPVAHHVLSDFNHPLIGAVNDNAALTTLRPGFISHLVSSVNDFLSTHEVSVEEESRIYKEMLSYDTKVFSHTSTHSAATNSVFTRAEQKKSEVEQLFANQLQALFESDPIFVEKRRLYNEALDGYLKELSPAQKRKAIGLGKRTYDNILQMKDMVDRDSAIVNTKNILDDLIKYYTMMKELAKTGKAGSVVFKTQRAANKFNNRNQNILNECRVIEAKYPYLVDPDQAFAPIAALRESLDSFAKLFQNFTEMVEGHYDTLDEAKKTYDFKKI